jgi:signal transduction histidine kinase
VKSPKRHSGSRSNNRAGNGRQPKPPTSRSDTTALRQNLEEALARETALTDILRLIRSSRTDVQPVVDAIAERAKRLCNAMFGLVYRVENGVISFVSHSGLPEAVVGDLRATYPMPFRDSPQLKLVENVLTSPRAVYLQDISQTQVHPDLRRRAELLGYRALVMMPLVSESEFIGVIGVGKKQPNSFTERQIALLQTFADQAVIAIENASVLNNLKDSLNRETASGEILSVISRSTTDTQPVFDAIAQRAKELCSAEYAAVHRYNGEFVYFNAHAGLSPEAIEVLRTQVFPYRPAEGGTGIARALRERRPVQIDDLRADAAWRFPVMKSLADYRTLLMVPMLHRGEPVGVISVGRSVVRRFSDEEVRLLELFASQAVIAIENVRLFNELQQRNSELTEALDHQTATSEILRVISSSPTNDQPVFETILRNAVRLSCGVFGALYRFDGKLIHLVASYNQTPETWQRTFPRPLNEGGRLTDVLISRRPLRISDVLFGQFSDFALATFRAMGVRSALFVPMLQHDQPIGVIALFHRELNAFSDQHVALLETFADQAVIAVENTRLFEEIQQKSRQLEAANRHKDEFLASMSHELRTPLNAVIGFSEVLIERMFGDVNEKQEEYLNDILASGRHLLSLINDILDLTKIEAGRMELDVEEFDVSVAIDNALVLIRERATRKGLSLEWQTTAKLGTIRADQRKFKQILLNLLSNALKFTPEGGRIELRAVRRDGHIEFAVTDTGVGIAKEDQEAVFEEFRQVGDAVQRREGTGLGLALARKFVELHGGQMWLESELGKGSTFSFTLPATQRTGRSH